MYTDRETVLANAAEALNKPNQPWEITVEDDCIVARWKWMDATFFTQSGVSNKVRNYMFVVTLRLDGRWQEFDKTTKKSAALSPHDVSFAAKKFAGKTVRKTMIFGFGKNKQTGESGFIGIKFDTTAIKKPIRDYLKSHGWRSAGLF